MNYTYTNKFVEFLNGGNTIIIGNENDYDRFVEKIHLVGLGWNYSDYNELVHIAKINGCLIDGHIVLVEYQPYKGFSIGYATYEESEKWYGQSPWTVEESLR